jgi:hypothetical protein
LSINIGACRSSSMALQGAEQALQFPALGFVARRL